MIRLTSLAAAVLLSVSPLLAQEAQSPLKDGPTWAELRPDVAGERPIGDGSAVLAFEAPYRAHDAATVPVRITQTGPGTVAKLTLIVDENPAPVVAEIIPGPAMPQIDIETRVRVNEYSNVRVLAEMADGRLLMVGAYVKASGGCSAPAAKDAEAALASLGRMKVRWFDDAAPGVHVAQVMLRHPNYSGLQRNQVTQLFIPAHFVNDIVVKAGDAVAFTLSGGISISEDPSFRFTYAATADAPITVRAMDTEGAIFQDVFPVEPPRS